MEQNDINNEMLEKKYSSQEYLETFSDSQRTSEFTSFLMSLSKTGLFWIKEVIEAGFEILRYLERIVSTLMSWVDRVIGLRNVGIYGSVSIFLFMCGCLFIFWGAIKATPIPTSTPVPTRILPTLAITLQPTFTPIPTSTIPPTIIACVSQVQLRIRSGPGKQYEVIGGALPGNCYEFDGRSEDGNWVHTKIDTSDGWLATEYLDIDISIDTLTVLTDE